MITVHGRPRTAYYSGDVNFKEISKAKNAVKIPVIANGGVFNKDDADTLMAKTGCDGVMIGRGAMGNPWIFSQIISLENGVGTPFPTVSERMETAEEHLLGMIAHKGERVGLAEAKKHMSWYLHGLRGAAAARSEIMNAHSAQEVLAILRRLEREQNEGD
jgi:tRNA-dihydrouridine synthase